jgi:phosphoglycerate kinase
MRASAAPELDAPDAARPRNARCWASSAAGVSTKLDLLRTRLLDKLAIGGGRANTFLYAQGHDVGASYCERDLAETARDIIRLAGQNNCKLFLPLDIAVAEKLAPGARPGCAWARWTRRAILDAVPNLVEGCAAPWTIPDPDLNGPLGLEMPPSTRAR